MSASGRASLSLSASTSLPAADALMIVKEVASAVRGGGSSLLTTGIQNLGANFVVTSESPGRLALSLSSGKRLVQLATFSAVATESNGVTNLRVGGLENYRTTQSTMLGFIPVGPKMIAGMAPYKRFLDELSAALVKADEGASARIAEPG